MDPQTRAFLDAVALADQPSIASLPPAEGRTVFEGLGDLFLPSIALPSVTDHRTPGGVSFRLYRPTANHQENLPLTVYLHGGGWVLGNLDTHDSLCRHLARASQVAVASVDYRLAPEHSFPAPLDDAAEAWRHLTSEASTYHFDSSRVAVAGDSAGGNLAAALAIKLRDEKGPAPQRQLLVYPVISAACDTPSYDLFAKDHGLTREEMQWFWRCYLGDEKTAPRLASLDRVDDLRGLPPARILTAEYDVLRDEGESHAARLQAAGVAVELTRHPGLSHGFFHFAGVMDRGRETVMEAGQWLGEQLRDSPGEDGRTSTLTKEEQMAQFEDALKDEDWGHQPC